MSELQFSPRPNKKELDETTSFAPKFDDMGLIAAMAIDHETREPLMLAYMNEESLKMTIEKGEAVYYSRSRQEIWHKRTRRRRLDESVLEAVRFVQEHDVADAIEKYALAVSKMRLGIDRQPLQQRLARTTSVHRT